MSTQKYGADVSLFSDGTGAGDDLAELRGDLGLPGPVVLQLHLSVHLPGVLRGVLHGVHPLRRLRGGALDHGAVDHAAVVELVQVLPRAEALKVGASVP